MAILSADLRFFAAQFPTDDAYGGGPMSGNIVQDNVSANVFPLIGESDAAVGRLQMRKVYAAVLSANTDQLINAAVNVWTPPTDADVDVLQFKWGDSKTVRSEAVAALAKFPFRAGPNVGTVSGSGTTRTVSNVAALSVGKKVLLGTPTSIVTDTLLPMDVANVATVTAIAGSDVTFSFGPFPGSETITQWRDIDVHPSAPLVCGAATIAANVSSGASAIQVGRVDGRVIPDTTPYPSAPQGIASSGLALTNGTVPIFRPGGLVLIRDSSGSTTEIALVSSINYVTNTLTLSAPLTNSYTTTGRVTSLLGLGDLQAQAGSSFSQQTWTRVFSDALIGNPISANYNRTAGVIAVTNEGAETERWAFVFTTATDFKLIGETLGQIATGAVGTAFSPINPHTNEPFFTIPAAGWGTGWSVGNVLRLNTVGARAPFWATRCISPGATASTDSAVFQFRGSY